MLNLDRRCAHHAQGALPEIRADPIEQFLIALVVASLGERQRPKDGGARLEHSLRDRLLDHGIGVAQLGVALPPSIGLKLRDDVDGQAAAGSP